MKNVFNYKYRLYFRRFCDSFSQCKDVVYTNDINDIYSALNSIQGYDEYMLITNTENGPVIERNAMEPKINKRLVKKR